MAKLTKETRDALPASEFAVPGKRALPIHDADHARMAWDMVSKTKDLTPAERKEARTHIIERAKRLGLDTSDWEKGRISASMQLSAMSLNISTDEHPNKMPFTGILTRIGQPSDAPPGGSGGKLITISAEAAEKALSSLLGMAVDYKPDFDGHNPQAKVGIITAGTIDSDENGFLVRISGFIYKADFPEVAAEIKASQGMLGMSYEARNLYTDDPDANPVIISECTFTGAAILKKDKAAYRTTAIAAASEEENDMTPEQIKLLNDTASGVTALTASLGDISASIKLLAPKVEANAQTIAMVEPHARTLDAAADAMCAAGIGADAQNGHALALRKIAGNMRAAAALGHVPSAINRYEYSSASADAAATVAANTDANAKAMEAAMKPLNDQIAALGTKLADMQAAAIAAKPAPERKTLTPQITSLIARAGIEVPKDGEKLSLVTLDAAFAKANMSVEQRLQAKSALRQGGLLD